MTGWGQEGPLAKAAGHDINHIALTGALHAIGPRTKPSPPLNLVGDFGGGGMLLAFGMVCGLLERRNRQGQVVDAAMVDGTALLLGGLYGMAGAGLMERERPRDQRARRRRAFLRHHETKDGKFVCVGSIEPQFYDLLLEKTGLKGENLPAQNDRKAWAQLRAGWPASSAARRATNGAPSWKGSDVCFAPVLTMSEASKHPHAKGPQRFRRRQRLPSRTGAALLADKGEHQGPAAKRGQHTDEVLSQRGFSAKEIGELKAAGVIGAQ